MSNESTFLGMRFIHLGPITLEDPKYTNMYASLDCLYFNEGYDAISYQLEIPIKKGYQMFNPRQDLITNFRSDGPIRITLRGDPIEFKTFFKCLAPEINCNGGFEIKADEDCKLYMDTSVLTTESRFKLKHSLTSFEKLHYGNGDVRYVRGAFPY